MQAGNANQREATEYNNSHRTSHKTDTLPQVAESAGAVNGQDERRINAPPLTVPPVFADGQSRRESPKMASRPFQS